MVDLNIKLPEGFLDEEVRCGYTVTRQMKEVWAVELDLLDQFDNFMKKNHLHYWAIAGSLLGAVRHGGFIPWDDDIDVAVPRKDYKKLCEYAETEFKQPYFFQTFESDRGYFTGHAQLRNSETLGVTAAKKGMVGYNLGIFIDIFPLDNIPDNITQRKHYLRKISSMRSHCEEFTNNIEWFHKSVHSVKGKIKHLLLKFVNLFYPYRKECGKFERICERYNSKKCDNWGLISFSNDERFQWTKNDFIETDYIQFENLKIPVPGNYDSILKKTYGEYRTFVKGGSVHSGVTFDTNRSYREYFEKAT